LAPVAASPGLFRATFEVPAGGYEYKVALDNSWDENYGAGGVPGGANIAITAPGGPVTFTYDHATHVISDDTPRPLAGVRGAHWLRRDVIAWQPPAGAQSYRLHYAPAGGLRVEDGGLVMPSSGRCGDAGRRSRCGHRRRSTSPPWSIPPVPSPSSASRCAVAMTACGA
jgi:hypothetical protein